MKHLLLDTNILLDVLADRQPHSIAAAKIFDYADSGKIVLYISSLSFSNIFYVIRKSLPHNELIKLLKEVESLTVTMDVTREIILKSLNSEFRDFEDAIQYFTALSNKKVEAIITRDRTGYKKSDLPIFSPEEALQIIEK
jgi:predicted nucleic acid-binding protein